RSPASTAAPSPARRAPTRARCTSQWPGPRRRGRKSPTCSTRSSARRAGSTSPSPRRRGTKRTTSTPRTTSDPPAGSGHQDGPRPDRPNGPPPRLLPQPRGVHRRREVPAVQRAGQRPPTRPRRERHQGARRPDGHPPPVRLPEGTAAMTTTTDVTLDKQYVLAGTPGWGEHDHLIRTQGLAVVNAPRYVAGDLTWTGESRNGRYYAAGHLERMAEGWHADGAVLLVEITPHAVLRKINRYITSHGYTLQEITEKHEDAIGDLAREMCLPWENAWLQMQFAPSPKQRDAFTGMPMCEHDASAQTWFLQVVRPGDLTSEDVEIGMVGRDDPTVLLHVKTRAAALQGRADQFQIGYLHSDLCRTADDPAGL